MSQRPACTLMFHVVGVSFYPSSAALRSVAFGGQRPEDSVFRFSGFFSVVWLAYDSVLILLIDSVSSVRCPEIP